MRKVETVKILFAYFCRFIDPNDHCLGNVAVGHIIIIIITMQISLDMLI